MGKHLLLSLRIAAVLILLGLASPVAAQGSVVVVELSGPSREAIGGTAILKSLVGDNTSAAETRRLGKLLTEGKALPSTPHGYIAGRARVVQGQVEVVLQRIDAKGKTTKEGVAMAPVGHASRFSEELSKLLKDLLAGRPLSTLPGLTPAALESLSNAYLAASNKDWRSAGSHLRSVPKKIGINFPVAKSMAAELSGANLSSEEKLLNSLAVWDLDAADEAIEEAPSEEKEELTLLRDARIALEIGDSKKTRSILKKLKKSQRPGVEALRSLVAAKGDSKRDLDKSLHARLESEDTRTEALAWASNLPPGSLSPKSEELLLRHAMALPEDQAALRSNLIARAGSSGLDVQEHLPLVNGTLLSEENGKSLQGALLELSDNADGLRIQSEMMVAQGDLAGATQLLSDAGIDIKDAGLDESLGLTEQAGLGRNKTQTLEQGGGESLKQDGRKLAQSSALQNEIREVLKRLPSTADHARVVVAHVVANDKPRWYALRKIDHDQLANEIASVIGPNARVSATDIAAYSRPQFVEQIQENSATSLIAFESKIVDGVPSLRLMYFNVTYTDGRVAEGSLPSGKALVKWNRLYIVTGVALFALFVLNVIRLIIFGRGHLTMRVELAGETNDLVLAVSRHAPDESGKAFRLPWQKRKLVISQVNRRNEIHKLIGGTWYIHVSGTYERLGEILPLKPQIHKIKVQRGKTTVVDIDPNPKTAELRVVVHGGDGPVEKATLQIGESIVEYTDKTGKANVDVPLGAHEMVLSFGEEQWTIPVECKEAKVYFKTLNLERLRRQEEYEEGIFVEGLSDQKKEEKGPPKPKKEEPPKELSSNFFTGSENKDVVEISDLATPPPAAQPTAPLPEKSEERTAKTIAALQTPPPPVQFNRAAAKNTPPTIQFASPKGPTPTPSGALAAGSTPGTSPLARYETLDQLGAGAMGAVYKARDTVLDRLVAVKVMAQELDEHPKARELFLTEAKALAALNHPNIVTVFDQGNDNGKLFIVMEFVEGTTLEDKLSGGPLPADEVAEIGTQLARALAYAHERRVIHRDIKPANIFITNDGIAKLGDFGLARVVNEVMIKKTEVKGTPLYMAPEQIVGTNIDFRADIYALGCTLFETATGRPPFIDGQILYHHLHTPPPRPRDVRNTVSAELDEVLFRCIQKEASDRFASAAMLQKALRQVR